MARGKPAQRRIDKDALRRAIGDMPHRTIARQLAERDGKTLEGARSQLLGWLGEKENDQWLITNDNAVSLGAVIGNAPDEWSRPVTQGDLAREKARTIRKRMREEAARARELERFADSPEGQEPA